MVSVPASYATLVQQMSQATGIPQNVIAAQANEESGFNATAVSSANAEGWLQFLPSTYDSYAAQAGVSPGTEFNPADESKVYDVYMKTLLSQEHGNLRNALAAYNAGPGDLAAGYGYADTILSNAGSGNLTISGSGSSSNNTATTTSANTTPFPGGSADPLNWPFQLWGTASNAISGQIVAATSSLVEAFLQSIGVKSVKDLLTRAGLLLVGLILVIAGIYKFASKETGEAVQILFTGETGSAGTRVKNAAQNASNKARGIS